MKARLLRLVALLPLLCIAAAVQVAPAHAYTNSHLIDDSIFDNTNSMSAAAVQNFFNANYPNGCLTNYQAPDPQSWSGYGGNVAASQVIADAAHLWGINPQVILATLEKEEGLVSGHGAYGCSQTAFNSAMGYDCPGPIQPATGTCVAHQSNLGFSAQVSHGAWQLEFGRYRSEGNGNLSYDGDGAITYYGYMTQGTRPRCSGCASQYYSGNITLNDGTNLNVENGATASLYSYTPFLQSFSRIFEQFFGAGSTTVPTYAWQWVSQSSDHDLHTSGNESVVMQAGGQAVMTVVARNVGTATWYNSGPNQVDIATDNPEGRSTQFADPSWINSITPARLQQSSVAPGQTGSFVFTVTAPSTFGLYPEYFNLVAQNITWFNDDVGQFFNITVTGTYRWSWNAQSSYTDSSKSTPVNLAQMSPGQTAWLVVKANNTGTATWTNTGPLPVRIGTANPLERPSQFATSAWISPSRPTTMVESSVAPGHVGTFEFPITIPATSGSFREYFDPLAENYTWMNEDVGQFFPITVNNNYRWSWNAQSSYTDSSKSTPVNLSQMSPGQTAWLVVKANNTGTSTWYNSGNYPVRIGTDNPLERTSRFATNAWLKPSRPTTMVESSVAPGGVATFEFPIQIPAGGGTWREYFDPLAENLAWMNEDVGQFFPITVNSTYRWSWNAQSSYTDSTKTTPLDLSQMTPGQTAWLVVKANNTGNATWYSSGSYPVRIGTANPLERTSRFATNAWLRPSRPTTMVESSVAPGGVATFEFPIQAPSGTGSWREYFDPLAENFTWMNEDVGQFFNITVH